MAVIVLPSTLVNGTTGDADQVQGDFASILAQVNGNIDADNIADGGVITSKILDAAVTTPKIADGNVTSGKLAGSIPFSKLAAGADAKVPIGNGSVLVERAISGALALTDLGVASLVYGYAQQALDTNIPNVGGFANINSLTLTPAAGRWALLSKIVINSGLSTGLGLMVSRLNKGGSALDTCDIEGDATGTDYLTMINMAVADFDGATAVVVEAGGFADNTIVTKANQGGWLVGLRLS